MSDLQERHKRRQAAIDAAVSQVARECGVTKTVVRVIWWHSRRSEIAYPVRGPFVTRDQPHKPRNLHHAHNAGAIHAPKQRRVDFWTVEFHELTELGRRIFWRITEEIADLDHET